MANAAGVFFMNIFNSSLQLFVHTDRFSMMMQKLLLPFLCLLSINSVGQSDGEELINWNEEKKLTWADYKGKVTTSTDAAASTATYLGIEYSFNNNGFGYKITCSFSKNKSWGLHKTAYILAHEQGHFDIAEIFARKLNKQMREYKFDKNSFKEDLKEIYTTITAEKEQTQNSYDKETNHSINKEKQAEWLKKIDELLIEYKAFANYNS